MTMMSSNPAPDLIPAGATRRGFLKRAALATAVLIPSLQVLSSPDASAATHKAHCWETYCHIVDAWCNCGRYQIQYACYCAICGKFCKYEWEDGGSC